MVSKTTSIQNLHWKVATFESRITLLKYTGSFVFGGSMKASKLKESIQALVNNKHMNNKQVHDS